jgi:hypothetical protein
MSKVNILTSEFICRNVKTRTVYGLSRNGQLFAAEYRGTDTSLARREIEAEDMGIGLIRDVLRAKEFAKVMKTSTVRVWRAIHPGRTDFLDGVRSCYPDWKWCV